MVNQACGRKLLWEHDPGAITVVFAGVEEEMHLSRPGYTILGLWDDQSNTVTFYPSLDDDDMIRDVAAHEFLHAMGLPHNDREGDIMNPHYTPGQTVTREDVTELGHWCRSVAR